jgi:hypothetical protein
MTTGARILNDCWEVYQPIFQDSHPTSWKPHRRKSQFLHVSTILHASLQNINFVLAIVAALHGRVELLLTQGTLKKVDLIDSMCFRDIRNSLSVWRCEVTALNSLNLCGCLMFAVLVVGWTPQLSFFLRALT